MKKFLFLLTCTIAVLTMGSVVANAFPNFFENTNPLVSCAVALGCVNISQQRWGLERLAPIVNIMNTVSNRAIIIQRSQFISEQLIVNNSGTYVFVTDQKSMVNTQSTFPLQQGVKDNDIFYALEYRVYIYHRTGNGDTAIKLQTYPNPLIFTAANTGDAEDLYALFQGQYQFKVGSTVYIPNNSIAECLRVPMAQKTLATNESDFDGKSLVEMNPYPVLSGRSDNSLILNCTLPAGFAGAALDGQGQNIIRFQMAGFTLQNAEGFLPYLNGEADIEADFAKWKQDKNSVFRNV